MKVIPSDTLVMVVWFVSASIVYQVKMERAMILKYVSVSMK